MFSVRTGLRLCGMAEEPFCPSEELFRLQNLGALQVPDLDRQALQGRGDDAEGGKEHRVPVARDHLGGDRSAVRPIFSANVLPSPRVDVGEGADRPEMAQVATFLAGRDEAAAVALELGIGLGQLHPKVTGSAWMPCDRPMVGSACARRPGP